MTILYPSALIFLSFIGVPILLHILNRFYVTKVNFSTIRFVKNLKNNALKRLKFKKMILLLARIGIISALVLLFARPVTKGFMPGWISAELDSRLLLVIDNSSSMSGKKNSETLLDLSKKAVITVSQLFKENTSINVLITCPPQIVFSGKINDPSLTDIINLINPTVEHDNLWAVIDSMVSTINAQEPIKECVVFSDFQNVTYSKLNLSNDWRFYLVDPGEINNNLSISNLEVVSRIKVPDQLLKLKTSIKNTGNKKIANTPINLLFENNRVGQVISEFEKASHKEFIFQAYPGKKGVLTGSIHLPKDDYLNDNKWYVTAPILDKINCLVVGNSKDELSMFKLVIDAIDPNKQLINLELRKQPIVNRLFIEDIDILVIHNPKAFTQAAFDELDIFLKRGGGLIWFSGGMEIDPAYGKYFSGYGFPKAKKIIESGTGIFSLEIPERNNQMLSNLNIRKLENELPEYYRYVRHNYSNKHDIHLRLTNGDPILLEFSRGTGNVFYFSSLLNLSWNNMPIRGLLVPLMYRLLVLGGTDEVNTSPVAIGETKWIKLDQNEVRDQWEIISPSGKKNLIVPDFAKESLQINLTNELGVYDIYQNEKHYTSFSTYLHPNELITNNNQKNKIEKLLSAHKYKWIGINNNFSNNFNEIRQGKSLWKVFLLIATLLLLLETWVGRPIPKNTK